MILCLVHLAMNFVLSVEVKDDMKYNFPKIKHKYPLTEGEKSCFVLRDRPLPSQWAQDNLILVPGGYDIPGKLTLKPYQIEPIDAITQVNRLQYCGSTRTFKSGMTDICAFWAMKHLGINGMVAYSETGTAKLIFKTRIKPMIEKNPCLLELWDGLDDNLTIENILLQRCFWRIASAQNKNDMASTGAGFVIGSEVSKWEDMTFSAVDMLYGRQDAYPLELRYSIIESSPYKKKDNLYKEMYKRGVLILSPAYPCSKCGEYQILTDSQIKLREHITNDNSTLSVSAQEAAKIREQGDSSVFYECKSCHQEILQSDREKMDHGVKYIAPAIKEMDGKEVIFEQQAEQILKDGTIIDLDKRKKYKTWCFHWTRLVDINFTFAECLARFFESLHSPEKKKIYDNETMSRFSPEGKGKIELHSFEENKRPYYCNGPLSLIPDDVLIITAGIDSMDKEFYYVIQGWGEGFSSWILKYGIIESKFINDENISNREHVFEKFKNEILCKELKTVSGRNLQIRLAFIDRGGHREKDVTYLCKKISFLCAYIGLTKTDLKKELIEKSINGNFYLGQTEELSEQVGLMMESKFWYLPQDVDNIFIKQITAQYHIKKRDEYGNSKSIFVKEAEDHYRSCLNMSYAAAKLLKLDIGLHQDYVLKSLQTKKEEKIVEKIEQKKEEQKRIQRNEYFSRALGGR